MGRKAKARASLGPLPEPFNDGNWARRPWFLDSEQYAQFFTEHGFPRAAREEAFAGLARLYPPRICFQMLTDSVGSAALVRNLFVEALPNVLLPILVLGRDLHQLGHLVRGKLMTRLRSRPSYASAYMEVTTWARLLRRGFRVERPPEGPEPTPDFVVSGSTHRYAVELKRPATSDVDRLAAAFTWGSVPWSLDLMVPGRVVRLLPSPQLEEQTRNASSRAALEAKRAQILAAFEREFRGWKARGAPVGRFEVEPYGAIEVEHEPGTGHVECELISRGTAQYRAERVARTLARGPTQLQGNRRGILVAEIDGDIEPRLVFQLILEQERGLNVPAERLPTIILRGMTPSRGFKHDRWASVLCRPPSKEFLGAEERRLIRCLGHGDPQL